MEQRDYKALQCGRFLSRGKGRHAIRTLHEWELIFVISGTLDMFVAGARYHLTAGERLLLDGGLRHGGFSDYPINLSFYWIHFEPRNREAEEKLCAAPRQLPIRSRARRVEYLELYLARQADNPEDQTTRDLILELILHEANQAAFHYELDQANDSADIQNHSRLALTARRMIELQFFERISTSAIARKLGCNPDYLGRLYLREFKTSITQDIHRMRLSLVQKLLDQSSLSIKEIAMRSGFEDLGHFRRVFFRRYAMTPSEYRGSHIPGRANSE